MNLTYTNGPLTIETDIGQVGPVIKWNGIPDPFLVGVGPGPNELVFKRTPTRGPHAEMIAMLESLSRVIVYVDVTEQEVP